MSVGILEQLEETEAELASARQNKDVVILRKVEAKVAQLLTQFQEGQEEANSILVKALGLHGQSLAALFDLSGQVQHIQEAAGEFRRALTLAVELKEPVQAIFPIQANLASATLRYAEQIDSRSILGESLSHLTALKGNWALDKAPPSLHPVLNSYCLAKFRLGQVTGDRGLIKEACRDFSSFLANPSLQGEMETKVMNNGLTATFESARRHRNPEILKVMIEYLEPRTRSMSPNLPFLLKKLADCHVELAKITKDTKALEHAIGNLEVVCQLMRRFAHSGPLVAALQSLAAAFYQLSRYSEVGAATEYLGKAIASAREAQNILRTKGELDDARMIRILIDLGAYQFEQGVKTGDDPALLHRAEEDFQAAMSRSFPERSPWLAFRASLGHFRLFCHRENWESALEAFAQMEKAWAVALTDQQLSHEVHDQKVTEMEGVYSLAAYCCLKVSDVEGAVGILERGRAQKMSLFPAGATASGSTVSERDRSELVAAIDQWEWSRNLGSLEECQRAWRTYEGLLRKHGLGMMPTSFDATGLKRILPDDAVMVHLFNCPAGVFAILTFGDGRQAQQVIIPTGFRQKFNLFLWSPETRDGRCWGSEYRRFRDPSDDIKDGSETTFQSWHETVEEVIDLLGVSLLQPIHDELIRHECPRKGRVYLAPPGEFAALPLSSGRLADGSIFGEHWQVSLIPNGTFLPQEEDEATEQSMVTVGHRSEIKGERGPLRFVSREAELVGEHLPAETKSLLLDEMASVKTTLTKMREASVIHMACHGTFEIRSPESSGIHLPGGELLPIARLKRTDRYHLNARLVFMSCCESGITGRSIPPDEFVGLLPSLLKCGAKAAIGSLWPVYDDAAMCLCLKFYQVYLDEDGTPKVNPAAALSAAKSWLREVSAAELIETGWISENEIIEILSTRRNTRMLRIRPVEDSQPTPEWDESASTPQEQKANPEQLELKPFSSPVDWAAFVMLGA